MEGEHYYHMFANGDDAKNFITSELDFKKAFNRFAVCSFLTSASVLSFSVEDTHPHALLYGMYSQCIAFKEMYESMSVRSIARSRGSAKDVNLHCEIYEISDEHYLMNVGAYTIVQAIKDVKAVMPYDYLYGTGALYFRSRYSVLPWLIDDNGNVCTPVPLASLTLQERCSLCGTRARMPEEWTTCNGFILPTCFVDVTRFEEIYRTHNCFRVFLSSRKAMDVDLMAKMSEVRGVVIDDLEARKLCMESCQRLFRRNSTTHLNAQERIMLSRHIRQKYHLSFRQLASLVHVPEDELRKYVK